MIISVIMSTYNESECELKSAIESVLHQSYKNFEFIIVIDNPENQMLIDIIEQYCVMDKRILVLKNECNMGLVQSLNRAILVAKGEYIARMDADDISIHNRFEKELEFMEKHSLDMVCALKKDIDENGVLLREYKSPQLLPEDVSRVLPLGTFVVHSSVMFKRELIDKTGFYRNVKTIEDYDLWLRFLSKGARIGLLNESLILYRIRSNSISSNNRYRQILSTQFLQNEYYAGRINEENLVNRLDAWMQRNGVDNSKLANLFCNRVATITTARSMSNNFKKITMYLKCMLYVAINKNFRLYVIRAFKFKTKIHEKE